MTALPEGLQIALDPRTSWTGRDALVGGSPRQVLRLSAAGRRAVEGLERGDEAPVQMRALGRRLLDLGLAHPRPRPGAAQMSVCIVIPAHNRAADLERCLAALEPGQPVIVVDDGSQDRAAVAAGAERHGAQLIRRESAGGPAAARNAALAHANAEIVAFLDSDCIATPGWLAPLLAHFADPLVAAVAPRIRPHPAASALGRYLAVRCPLDMGAQEGYVDPAGPVRYVPSAALLVRRSALGDGFDEALRYGEDVDLVWRLREAGGRVRYEPSVIVEHAEPLRLRDALRRRALYGSSAGALSLRHPGALPPLVLNRWPAAILALLIARQPLGAAALAAARSTLLARRLRPLGLSGDTAARWTAEATSQTALATLHYGNGVGAPLVAAALIFTRRRRWLALLLVPALLDRRARRPDLGSATWTALFLADEGAYAAGVWRGCLRTRSARPLIPAIRIRRRATA